MRRIPAIFLAVFVALGLFWLMNALVNAPTGERKNYTELGNIDFIRLKQQQTVDERDRRKPPKPPPPKKPPPPPKLTTASQPKPQQQVQNLNIPNLNLPTNISGGPFLGTYNAGAQQSGSSEAIPLVRIQPQYPRRAARSGTEGYVSMDLIINPDGTVRDVKVTDAKPRGLFESAAVAAILKWKFKPKIVDGTPIQQRASQTMKFSLNR